MNKKKEFTQEDLLKFRERADELNPVFMFSLTATQLLTEALEGKFDLNYLIRWELCNRGLNLQGKWVGFKEARRIHGIN